jgi:hypothetical protein
VLRPAVGRPPIRPTSVILIRMDMGVPSYWAISSSAHQTFIGSSDLALTAIDPRFPHYYQSCAMAAGSTAKLTFTIDPSAGLRPGVYMGNCFLVLRGYLGVGTHLDRVAFDMTVI